MEGYNKVVVWTKGIDEFLTEQGNVGGITVQMYFWAKTFIENNWNVYSFSQKKSSTIENIQFLRFPTRRFIGIFIDVFYSFYFIAVIRPKIIVVRGASRNLCFLRIYCWIFYVKLVYFGASDSDFQPGKELIRAGHDKRLFRFGLQGVRYFVVQNSFQRELLRINYALTNCIVIPNIWKSSVQESSAQFANCILWVSNIRKLKRPEWFIDLAREFPKYRFVMAGGALDKVLYDKCKKLTDEIHNIEFMGMRKFAEVNMLFASCKTFLCTSEIEGFPNTFLQAWQNRKPIITTFDPSGVVKKNTLGIVVQNKMELKNAIKYVHEELFYSQVQDNIGKYFINNHDAGQKFNLLLNFMSK